MSDDVSHNFGAALVPDDGLSEEVDVDIEDEGMVAKNGEHSPSPPAAQPVAPAPSHPPSAQMRAGTEPKKTRPRMSIRVPDDEVVRPAFSRTGETRVFRADELDHEPVGMDAPPVSVRPGTGASSEVTRSAPPRPEVPRPRAASVSSEVALTGASQGARDAEAGRGVGPLPPMPRPPTPSAAAAALEPPRPRTPSMSSEISAPPRPRSPSMSSEIAVARSAAPSVSTEFARAPMSPLAESAPDVGAAVGASDTKRDLTSGANAPNAHVKTTHAESTGEIKPSRIISVVPGPLEPEEVPSDLPTLTDMPPSARESADSMQAAAVSRDVSSDAIPITEDVEQFEARGHATDPAPPPTAPVDARVVSPEIKIAPLRTPALTIPDAYGVPESDGIDISVEEDSVEPPAESEVASDDLLSVESVEAVEDEEPFDSLDAPVSGDAPRRRMSVTQPGALAQPVPVVGMSSEPNVAQFAQTPPGGAPQDWSPPPSSSNFGNEPASAPKLPVAAAAVAQAVRPPRQSSPLLIVPPDASPLAPQPMTDAAASRKRQKPWWEDLFNDDFIRTMSKITDEQIAREVDFIEDSLGVARGAMVLDMACGTGRHAIDLTRRGYRVVGLDLSLAMLAKAAEEAQERNQKLNFVQGDMREMTFEDMFDGVYCWNTSFGFFEEERNAQVISRVHRALRKGGQFVLDVINRDFALQQQPSLVWFEGDGCICMDEMQIDWITSRMRVKRTMMMDDGRSREIEYSIRIYSLHELGKLLHDHGFRVAEVSGRVSTPGVFFGSESPNVLILAEKR